MHYSMLPTMIIWILILVTDSIATTPTWYTDYQTGMVQAYNSRRNLVIYFCTGTDINQDLLVRQLTHLTLRAIGNQHIYVKIPLNTQATVNGQSMQLIRHSSFAELHNKTGIAIIDYTNKQYFGEVVSIYPLSSRNALSTHNLYSLLTLPPGSLTQRTLILAVRIHPERPSSTSNALSPILAQESENHSKHQASINLQGHHNWNTRFNRIIRRVGGRSAQEVCAESWSGMGLFAAAVDCVHSWRQSSGHWGAVQRRHDYYGYDMKRGSNGIWYATGIFASR